MDDCEVITVQFQSLEWMSRHAKRLNFDTSGFLEDPKLTRKQRDSRQKIHGDKPNNHKILYFWSTNR